MSDIKQININPTNIASISNIQNGQLSGHFIKMEDSARVINDYSAGLMSGYILAGFVD